MELCTKGLGTIVGIKLSKRWDYNIKYTLSYRFLYKILPFLYLVTYRKKDALVVYSFRSLQILNKGKKSGKKPFYKDE